MAVLVELVHVQNSVLGPLYACYFNGTLQPQFIADKDLVLSSVLNFWIAKDLILSSVLKLWLVAALLPTLSPRSDQEGYISGLHSDYVKYWPYSFHAFFVIN